MTEAARNGRSEGRRWTVRYCKAKARADGPKPVDIAIPVYGFKSHVSIDHMHGVIRRQIVPPFRNITVQCPAGQGTPPGTMPQRTSRANSHKSMVSSRVEQVFAQQKARIVLPIRTICLAGAKATITLANTAYNMTRLRWLQSRTLPA